MKNIEKYNYWKLKDAIFVDFILIKGGIFYEK